MISGLLFSWLRSLLDPSSAPASTLDLNILRVLSHLLIAPVVEEWVFRKQLPTLLSRKVSPFSAVIISNIIFAFAHLDWYLVPYFANGCLYAMCFAKTGDIKTSMTAHGLYNGFVLIFQNMLQSPPE